MRPQRHRFNVLARRSRLRFRLRAARFLNCDTCLAGRLTVREILLHLRQMIPRRFQREIVLLRHDRRQQRIFLYIQFSQFTSVFAFSNAYRSSSCCASRCAFA